MIQMEYIFDCLLIFSDLYEKCSLFERLTKIEEDFPGANVILHKVPNMPVVSHLYAFIRPFIAPCISKY